MARSSKTKLLPAVARVHTLPANHQRRDACLYLWPLRKQTENSRPACRSNALQRSPDKFTAV
jgi:hypothetical protein